jgi:hypothetical protein
VDIVPVAELSAEAKPVVEKLRGLLSKVGLGVTLQGTHLSVRWRIDGQLVQVTMIVDAVDDGNDDPPEDFH